MTLTSGMEEDRAWENRVGLALRTMACLFCLGWGFWLISRFGTHTGTWLLMERGWDHAHIGVNERRFGLVLVVVAGLVWLPHGWWLALPVGLLNAFDAWMGTVVGGFPFSGWTPGAQAGRYLPMLAFFVWGAWGVRSTGGRYMVEGMLRVGLATVFVVHGLEAWWQHPVFLDYVIGTAEGLAGWEWTEETAFWILKTIGVVDLAVALLLLGRPSPWLLAWAAFWGLLTAFARVTTHGAGVYFEVLIRAGHIIGPLVVYGLREWRRKR